MPLEVLVSRHPTANTGKRLGRYRIERELGRGGMGVVYLAEDENTGRLVALKTTSVAGLGGGNASRNQRRARFIREVQALTNINHDNVVHVFDAGESDDADLGWLLFYSMDFVDGLTLAQLVQRRGALDARAAAAVVMQVADGLGAAHRAGIVHRDVKPANIFISHHGRALIGDFGICKIEGSTQITRRDQLVGTPNYLAPEQILGEPVSPATDVFALGALYYVITMNRPLRAQVDPASLLRSAQSDEAREHMLAERGVPERLRKVIARCLERDPKKRWPDGEHLAHALKEHASVVPPLPTDATGEEHRAIGVSADRTNPFSSSRTDPLRTARPDDVEQVGDAGADAVEAAARALLGEVEGRFGGDRADKKAAPLPVARTESTVMFNLRAMEESDERKADARSAADADADDLEPLPVARTESTAIFKMREAAGGGDGGVHIVERDAPKPTAPGYLGEPTPAVPEETREAAPLRRFEPPPREPTRKAVGAHPLGRVPRPVLLGATGALGALFGLLVAVAFAPAQPTQVLPPAGDQLVLARRPSVCPDVGPVSDEDQRKASVLVQEALALKRAQGGTPREAIDRARRATELNPYDKLAFFTWATLLVEQPATQKDAFVCVCLVAEGSSECASALKALDVRKIIPPVR